MNYLPTSKYLEQAKLNRFTRLYPVTRMDEKLHSLKVAFSKRAFWGKCTEQRTAN